ncbi:MAG: GxxExxY protein [Anaerolineales bacterium]|nr:GxxExxY protein [Anaerolineales bacterium]MCX7608153.1 GxxExxY protein [Anaerolineales bacterium]
MNPVYEAQLLTYLRLTGVRLGYLKLHRSPSKERH